jgi:quercetin dioxygenase-like cupin family protein
MQELDTTASAVLEAARVDEHGRHAELLIHDGPLRQTVIAIRAGAALPEHNSPPAASVLMVRGRVRITGERPAELSAGDLVALAHSRHSVEAVEDSVFLLTTVTSQPDAPSYADPPEVF